MASSSAAIAGAGDAGGRAIAGDVGGRAIAKPDVIGGLRAEEGCPVCQVRGGDGDRAVAGVDELWGPSHDDKIPVDFASRPPCQGCNTIRLRLRADWITRKFNRSIRTTEPSRAKVRQAIDWLQICDPEEYIEAVMDLFMYWPNLCREVSLHFALKHRACKITRRRDRALLRLSKIARSDRKKLKAPKARAPHRVQG